MEAQATSKTVIRPNIANMVKTPGGSYHKDDFIGSVLAGLSVDQVKEIASCAGLDVAKYEHLNPGQQRMTLGNKLRKLTSFVPEDNLTGPALDTAIAANKAAEELRDTIEELAADARESNAAAKAEVAAVKEREKAEKAAAKEAKPKKERKAKAKLADDAEGEGDAE